MPLLLKNMNRIYYLSLLLSLFNCQSTRETNVKDDKSREQIVVCIDPGHPSETNDGRVIQNGISELDINWQIALKLDSLLSAKNNIKVILTRNFKDSMVTNIRRAEMANSAKADIFLRLHCDTGTGKGFTVYYPDRQGRKNSSVGPDSSVINASRSAAVKIHNGMREMLKDTLFDNGIKGDSQTYIGSRQGALTGSIYSKVPVVLVEIVFLSDKEDAEFIKSIDGQLLMARSLMNGVLKLN